MHVCDNVGDHLIGNVYARYEWETEAQNAVDSLNTRWYAGAVTFTSRSIVTALTRYFAGRPLYAELSPVTDFREACCRQNENGECNRGGFCNFMHLRLASKELVSSLHASQRLERRLNPAAQEQGGGGWEPGKRTERSTTSSRQRSASPSRRRGTEREWETRA